MLITCISLFLTAFLMHLILWRIRHPKSPVRAILIIFFMTFIAGTAVLLNNYEASKIEWFGLHSMWDILRIFLLYLAWTFTYCFIYHGFEDDSPSLFIVLNIWNSHNKGMTVEELVDLMPDEVFFKNRIEYLVIEKLAVLENGRYSISKKGKSILKLFLFLIKLMKQDSVKG